MIGSHPEASGQSFGLHTWPGHDVFASMPTHGICSPIGQASEY